MDKGGRLSENHKNMLNCDFSVEDIKFVLDNIPNNIAHRMDGFGSLFFKHSWNTLKHDIHAAVVEFFLTGKILKEVNVTSITLVPKIPSTDHIIPPTFLEIQSSENSNPWKLNSVLPDVPPIRVLLLLLDLRKAYDIVEWEFIREVMTDLDFPTHFINLIMTCLTTTQYSILINGAPTGLIQPKRGLRQGDHLSPLLFTLCVEYFSRAMAIVSEHPHFSFHPRCRRLSLNHLCFADDL
ncbi:uncharacterized protein [Spinacia oleracea]|uniref:Reverse transcriptase domain-containing protein n=1 Tax=Spinacia oleracea TaxID=3562 RepID=A0ABM3R8X7_SPIOL|nr:uncharacterized protein LOC130467554 [Spinacia oleracea]